MDYRTKTTLFKSVLRNTQRMDERKDTVNVSKDIFAIKKTLALLWVIWFGIFAAYNSLEVLQSSLNPTIGVISISLIYTSKILTSLVTPAIIRKLTLKWTVAISCLCHSSFVFANLYPAWFTLLPTGFLVGLATSPFWTCFNVYVTTLSVRYAKLVDKTKADVLSAFNGIAHTAIPLAFIIGNLLSSVILKYADFKSSFDQTTVDQISTPSVNASFDNISSPTETDSQVRLQCGPRYCPIRAKNNKLLVSMEDMPDKNTVYLLVSILGLFNLSGVLVAIIGLQNIDDNFKSKCPEASVGQCKHLQQYLHSLCEPRFLVLIPSLAYIHVLHSYVSGMFSRAYISCNVGIGMIGYFSMVTGSVHLVISPLSGYIGQHIQRNYLFLISFILVLFQITVWFLWDLLPNQMAAIFATAVISGLAMGNYNIHVHAFLGDTFTEKKMEIFAFSNFWAGIAVALGFISNNYICVHTQLYILVALKGIVLVSYTSLSCYLHKKGTTLTMDTVVNIEEMQRMYTGQQISDATDTSEE